MTYPEGFLLRTLDMEVRGIDEEARRADFVASTERPVPTWGGPEVLRMSGASLGRYRKNPVVLDGHNTFSVEAVIGRATVTVDRDHRRLLASVEFASTPRAEAAWTLVREGHLRAMSVGYRPDRTRTLVLGEGESDGEGDGRVVGPAIVQRRWELLELSLVPVPADEDALRRSYYGSPPPPPGGTMRYPDPSTGHVPAATAPASPAPEVRASQPAPTPAQPAGVESPDEAQARALVARRTQVMAIAPEGLRDVAEACVLEGMPLEAARARLLAAQAARRTPVGTPTPPVDPAAPNARQAAPPAAPVFATPEHEAEARAAFTRSLLGLRS